MTLSVCWANVERHLSDAESTSGWNSPNAESIWNDKSTTTCPIWHTGLVNTKNLTLYNVPSRAGKVRQKFMKEKFISGFS